MNVYIMYTRQLCTCYTLSRSFGVTFLIYADFCQLIGPTKEGGG
jgi:ribulose 1,5-bisphosphate carboxylase large subunit-like protein